MSHPEQDQCPVCDQAAYYVQEADRHYHKDGGDNRSCWRVIRQVRALHATGDTVPQLMTTFGVSRATIYRALSDAPSSISPIAEIQS